MVLRAFSYSFHLIRSFGRWIGYAFSLAIWIRGSEKTTTTEMFYLKEYKDTSSCCCVCVFSLLHFRREFHQILKRILFSTTWQKHLLSIQIEMELMWTKHWKKNTSHKGIIFEAIFVRYCMRKKKRMHNAFVSRVLHVFNHLFNSLSLFFPIPVRRVFILFLRHRMCFVCILV